MQPMEVSLGTRTQFLVAVFISCVATCRVNVLKKPPLICDFCVFAMFPPRDPSERQSARNFFVCSSIGPPLLAIVALIRPGILSIILLMPVPG